MVRYRKEEERGSRLVEMIKQRGHGIDDIPETAPRRQILDGVCFDSKEKRAALLLESFHGRVHTNCMKYYS